MIKPLEYDELENTKKHQAWPRFILWCKADDFELSTNDYFADWKEWWECFLAGYNAGQHQDVASCVANVSLVSVT